MRQIHFGIDFYEASNTDSDISMGNIFADNNLYDADFIGIHLNRNLSESIHVGEDGIHDSNDFLNRLNRFKIHLEDVLKHGKNVYIFCGKELEINLFDHIDQENYGVCYGPVHLNMILNLLPDNLFERKANGINLKFHESVKLYSEIKDEDIRSLFEYKFILPIIDKYNPIFVIKNTDFLVGYSIDYYSGKVFLLPSINSNMKIGQNSKAQVALLKSISSLLINFETKAIKHSILVKEPEWIHDLQILDEKSIKKNIDLLDNKIINIEREREGLKKTLSTITGYKSILYKSGKSLENQIILMLQELGLIVHESKEQNRVDAIIEVDDNRSIVVEIKGVKGSAGEKNAAQLEKWATEYYSETRIIPKGLLLVNTYKDTELSKRKEPDFPNQMLKFMKLKNQSGMTTKTFLSYFSDIKCGKLILRQFLDLIINSSGVIEYDSPNNAPPSTRR